MIKYKPKISELKKFRNILQKSIPHEDEITLLANRIKDIHKSEEKIKSNVN